MFKTIVVTGLVALSSQQLGKADTNAPNFLASGLGVSEKPTSSTEIIMQEANLPSIELEVAQKPFENPCVVSKKTLLGMVESFKKLYRISHKNASYLFGIGDKDDLQEIANNYNDYYYLAKDEEWHDHLMKKIVLNLMKFVKEADEMGLKLVEYFALNDELDNCTEEIAKYTLENRRISKQRKAIFKQKFNIEL